MIFARITKPLTTFVMPLVILVLVLVFSCVATALFSSVAAAQDTLSLQSAIEEALQNNYTIQIAKSRVDIAANNNNLGNAGFYPSVVAQGNIAASNTSIRQDFNTGGSINRGGATSSVLGAQVQLNWTIFDGLRMFATRDKLNALEAQSSIGLRVEIENTVLKITSAYFDVARQQQLIQTTTEIIRIYTEVIKIAKLKFEIGSASKVDLLRATVDMNAYKSQLLTQQNELQKVCATLNQLLSRKTDSPLAVSGRVSIDYKPMYADIRNNMLTVNSTLLFAKTEIGIADDVVSELSGLRLPQLNVFAGYSFNQSVNQVGFFLLNQNQGFSIGLNASWTLFNGFKHNTQIQAAQILADQRRLEYSNMESILNASLSAAFSTYTNLVAALQLEEESILLAQEALSIALQGYQSGRTSALEVLLVQRSYEEAATRLVTTRYSAKIAESEIRRLEGTIVN